jgi:hypothetical protein
VLASHVTRLARAEHGISGTHVRGNPDCGSRRIRAPGRQQQSDALLANQKYSIVPVVVDRNFDMVVIDNTVFHERHQKLSCCLIEASEIAGCLSNFSLAEDISTCLTRRHLGEIIILC